MSLYFTKHSLASGVGAWRRQCPGHGAAVIRLTGHIFSWIPKLCVWGNVCGGVDLRMLCAKALCSIGRKRHCCWQASSPRMGLKDVCSCWEPVPLFVPAAIQQGFIWARPSTTWHHQEHHHALTSCISPTETSCTRGTPGKNLHSSSTAILFSMPPVLLSV